MSDFRLTSSAFAHGQAIPTRHTCDGEDLSPPLDWSGVPPRTQSLALVMDDPDAPGGTFAHWVAWGIDPETAALAEGETAPREGANGFGRTGYGGPCPPRGHGPHRYFFRLYALEGRPQGEDELFSALDDALGIAELVGTYER